jgi:hypothetical protein
MPSRSRLPRCGARDRNRSGIVGGGAGGAEDDAALLDTRSQEATRIGFGGVRDPRLGAFASHSYYRFGQSRRFDQLFRRALVGHYRGRCFRRCRHCLARHCRVTGRPSHWHAMNSQNRIRIRRKYLGPVLFCCGNAFLAAGGDLARYSPLHIPLPSLSRVEKQSLGIVVGGAFVAGGILFVAIPVRRRPSRRNRILSEF